MKLEPYWLATSGAFTGGSQDDLPDRVDVAIVGGGFTGLSAARVLARQGACVAVLEGGRVIGQASGRNGGHINTGTAQSISSLAASHGEANAQRFYEAFHQATLTVARIIADEQIDCDYRSSGKLKLAAKPQHYAHLVHAHRALTRQGIDPDVELIARDRLREEIGSDAFYGGLLYRRGAQMHVGKFGIGLANAAVRAGATVYEQTPVTGVHRADASSWRVSTPRGRLRAGQVLVATGCSDQGPLTWLKRRIVPVGSFVVVTEPLGRARMDEVLPTRRNCVTSRIIGNYFRPTADDRLVFGGRARFAISSPSSDARSGDILRRALEHQFPQLAGCRLDYCWGGMVDMTADRLPRAGVRDGIYYSMGYSGHGVQMSVHMGEVMADIMAGHDRINPWADLPWPAVPGYFGTPWFLPLAGVYYRIKDAFN